MDSTRPAEALPAAAGQGADAMRVGLIGRGIQGSRSPGLHVREAAAQGFLLSYALIDLDAAPWAGQSLAQALERAETDGLAGVNITYPFKQEVLELLNDLSPDAERLGAVNTVTFKAGRRLGHNTDWSGFAENLQRGLPGASMRRVVQMGAGGAGAAVAYALLHEGVERLTVFDLDRPRAEDLVGKMNALFGPGRAEVGDELAGAMAAATGLVNATPVGMAPHLGSPVAESLLFPDLWVTDIVYVPIETQLLAAARSRGCQVLNGGGMTVFQAADAFRLFTGREPDPDRMRAGFLREIEPAA